MTKIPLLLAADPRIAAPPIVRLSSDKNWELEHNCIDSELQLHPMTSYPGDECKTLRFIKRGTERSITVYAVSV